MTDEATSGRAGRDEAAATPVDPGAAPGVSDAGSTGRAMGTGLAGAGTGTSMGASRGNTGPGTGSDTMEAGYGAAPPTRFQDMLGVGGEPPEGGEGGNTPLEGNRQFVEAARHVDPDAASVTRAVDTGTTASTSSSAGIGDNDIPAETDVP